eukprot:4569223-Prymnesium_polylepis.1
MRGNHGVCASVGVGYDGTGVRVLRMGTRWGAHAAAGDCAMRLGGRCGLGNGVQTARRDESPTSRHVVHRIGCSCGAVYVPYDWRMARARCVSNSYKIRRFCAYY